MLQSGGSPFSFFHFHVQSIFLIQVCALNVKKRLAKVSLFDSAQSEHTHTRTVHIHITIPLVWNSRRLTPHVMLLSVMSRQTIGSQGIVRYEVTHSNFVVIFLHLTLKYLLSWLTHKISPFHSLLITSEGHIKLTDFGLSKIGLVNCKSPNI